MTAQRPLQAWRVSRYLECGIADVSSCVCLWELKSAWCCSIKSSPKGPKSRSGQEYIVLNKGCEHFCSCSYDCLCSDVETFISTGLLLC